MIEWLRLFHTAVLAICIPLKKRTKAWKVGLLVMLGDSWETIESWWQWESMSCSIEYDKSFLYGPFVARNEKYLLII